jgi:hypothetical protein
MKLKAITLLVFMLIFTSCSQSESNQEISWTSEYNLTIEYYKVGVKQSGPGIEDYVEIVNSVKDDDDRHIIDNALDTEKWEVPDDEFSEEPMLFLVINSDTMLWLFGGGNHAQLMNYASDGENISSWTNVSDIVILNDDIYSIVKSLVGEY